ncbi:MAG TPA: Maf family protein [Porticoccaceae bacterium]
MMAASADFVLASASPRRADLLEQVGARFTVMAVDVDETPLPGEKPDAYVTRLAKDKARAAVALCPDRPVLAADTTVAVDGRPMGKPRDEADAIAMLMALSDRTHGVYTCVAMTDGERLEWRLSHTRVTFRALTVGECRAYWRTGEPRDKAGGYAIQGLGAVFVKALEGSYSGVVGLPLAETWELLQLFGIRCWATD